MSAVTGRATAASAHASHGIALDLIQYVPLDDPVKISRLRLENRSGRARRLTVTAYVEWVLGPSRAATAPFVVTERDAATGALLATNAWSLDFGGRIAFLDLAGRQTSWTGDRAEMLGRNGTPDHPDALERGSALSGRVGAGLDPCGALQVTLDLPAAGAREVVVLLGQGASRHESRALIARYRAADLDAVLHAVTTRWDDVLGAVQVRTPDRSLDLMLNRWLLYQALACRLWARSAFYQAGGAYGFRDQLQDVMALVVSARDLARRHLCRAASRQFVEGDVQHWWHPPSGRGVRTRISDDLVWLPHATAHYLAVTGDRSILDVDIPFLDGPVLAPGQSEAYFEPAVSVHRASLFEHCARALDRSLAVGSHGLPLIGTGDWNDGMNRVGHQGRGESVWLGWFLACHPLGLGPDRRGPRRGRAGRGVAPPRRRPRHGARCARLGRRLVSAGLLRRRDAPRLRRERRVPHRFHRAVVGGALRGGGSRARRPGDERGRGVPGAARPRPGPAVHPAVRAHDQGSRLHQGVSARGPGERRPVHARRHLGRHGLRRPRRRRPRR